METERPKAPGLKWRKRGGGVEVPYWIAGNRTINLSVFGKWVIDHFEGEADKLIRRCERLHIETRSAGGPHTAFFNGSFASLIDLYETDPESSYRKIKPGGSLKPYLSYIPKLRAHIGELQIADCDGRDVQRWFKAWAGVEDLKDPAAKLPRARFLFGILSAAVTFGILCKRPGCAEFGAVLKALTLPRPKRRKFAATAEQIVAVRQAARAAGAPLRALVYALQFETTIRQWDLIGQRIAMNDMRPGLVLPDGEKWIGPTWDYIDEHMILRVKPTKTEDTTEVEGVFDLSVCPMVMEELALIPAEKRVGPLIVSERSGLPYKYERFNKAWRRDFTAAGLPLKMWNRDFRASGSTEGSKAGATREDRAKIAGHSVEVQGRVYDRDEVEAHRRVMAARSAFRGKNGSGT